MATDPAARLLKQIPVVMRITERIVRAWPLGEWALLRRVMPDGGSAEPDARRFIPDKGSSLGFDDLGFMPDIGDHVVRSTARFPVMSAAENLVGAAQVHGAHFQEGRIATGSVAALCRSAMESSAKTVWLLGDRSREERHARCLGFIESEWNPQQQFIRLEEQAFALREDDAARPSDYENFQRHWQDYENRKSLVSALPRKDRSKPPGSDEQLIISSAKWIDAHPPPHAERELPPIGMALAAQRFYSFGSSFVHGYKWMRDYITDDTELFKIVADGLAAALIMTECAVALFEAQSTSAARAAVRRKNYSAFLAATVDAWAPDYR